MSHKTVFFEIIIFIDSIPTMFLRKTCLISFIIVLAAPSSTSQLGDTHHIFSPPTIPNPYNVSSHLVQMQEHPVLSKCACKKSCPLSPHHVSHHIPPNPHRFPPQAPTPTPLMSTAPPPMKLDQYPPGAQPSSNLLKLNLFFQNRNSCWYFYLNYSNSP